MDLGSGEIMLILLVALLIYGGRLPEVARALGRSLAELKRGLSQTRDAVTSELDAALPDLELDDERKRAVVRATPPQAPAGEGAPAEPPPPPPAGPAPSAPTQPPPNEDPGKGPTS